MRIIAQIEAGQVVNVILVADGSGFDASQGGQYTTVDVTEVRPQPAPGWTYAGGVFTAPTPTPVPDVNGFVTAVVADTSLAPMTRIEAKNSLAALQVAVASGQTALITAIWELMVSTYSISAGDQSAVAALASQFNIPGIS